jgi:predicted nucleic-acid-binding Zn-ribbon protein
LKSKVVLTAYSVGWCHNTEYNDTQVNGTGTYKKVFAAAYPVGWCYNTEYNDTQLNGIGTYKKVVLTATQLDGATILSIMTSSLMALVDVKGSLYYLIWVVL